MSARTIAPLGIVLVAALMTVAVMVLSARVLGSGRQVPAEPRDVPAGQTGRFVQIQ